MQKRSVEDFGVGEDRDVKLDRFFGLSVELGKDVHCWGYVDHGLYLLDSRVRGNDGRLPG